MRGNGTDRLRVAHLITRLELGGAQGNTLYTVSHLDRGRFQPLLITGRGGMLDAEAIQLKDIEVHFAENLVREIRPWSDWRCYLELKEILRKTKPDILHTHSSKAGILGRYAAAATGVPVVIHTYHGFGFNRYQNPVVFKAYVAAERAACRHANHLIFVSRENQAWAEELKLFDPNVTTSLIRSGIPVKSILATPRTGKLRQELKVEPTSKLVGMIACLKPQKDPVTFVRAAGLVLKKMPGTHFLLAGDGELAPAVHAEIARLPFPANFHFLGWRRDVHQILRELDLMMLTSLWEGLPRVIPEATVAGVPTVASDIDGNRESIAPGKNGLLAAPQSAEDFAAKATTLLEENTSVDEAYARKVCEEFDIDAMIAQQQELYFRLLKRE